METGIPLNQLYRLSSHLVFWRCGRVIDVIRKSNVYVVNTQPVSPIIFTPTTLHERFVRDCPGFSLLGLLTRFIL